MFLSLFAVFILIGATIYYIIMSEKRKTSIIVSIFAFCSGVLLTVLTTKPLAWKMFMRALSSGNLLNQGWGMPLGFVFGIGICLATAVIFIALLVPLIREASHMKSSKENKDYVSRTSYNYHPEYQAPSVSTQNFQDDEIMKAVKRAVCANLKSPASAQFPADFISVVGDDVRGYHITGYVDSQNSFGAMIRNDFTVDIDTRNGYVSVKSVSVGKNATKQSAKVFGINYLIITIFVMVMTAIMYFVMKMAIGF